MDTSFGVVYNYSKCTFNPFVVGSTPAGPTKLKSTLNFGSKCFFHARLISAQPADLAE